MNPLKIGDLVRLRSGGPPMTIVAIHGDVSPGLAQCWWFEKNADASILRKAKFPLLTLSIVDSSDWSLPQDEGGIGAILERNMKRHEELTQ